MNWIYRDVTVLSLISAFATAPAFSQALAQPSNPLGAVGAAVEAVGNKAGEALDSASRSLTPYSPPASVVPQTPATDQPPSPYPDNPPYWYFDRPAVPLSFYSGQPRVYALQQDEPASPYAVQSDWRFDRPAAPLSPYSGQPHPYVVQTPALQYAGQPYAYAAEPAAPVAYATRPYGDAN